MVNKDEYIHRRTEFSSLDRVCIACSAVKIVQTCYAKWLIIYSGYCEFNALVYTCRVELSLFFSFSFVVFFLVPVLFACATTLYGEYR